MWFSSYPEWPGNAIYLPLSLYLTHHLQLCPTPSKPSRWPKITNSFILFQMLHPHISSPSFSSQLLPPCRATSYVHPPPPLHHSVSAYLHSTDAMIMTWLQHLRRTEGEHHHQFLKSLGTSHIALNLSLCPLLPLYLPRPSYRFWAQATSSLSRIDRPVQSFESHLHRTDMH